MVKYLFAAIVFFACKTASGHNFVDTPSIDQYGHALQRLNELARLDGSFKEAVYIVENTYFNERLDQQTFYDAIAILKLLCKSWIRYNPIKNYLYPDSLNFQMNAALYAVLKDTIRISGNESQQLIYPPFTYDFTDYNGANNWANMFVSKLLITRKGNCHSLPYLYKILADEIGANCWLAQAPNHIYIENRCKKIGWYNTELTSGNFPIDAWIMASGYLPLQAVQNGIYMDTLSNQQSIALCILDLAKGYEHQTHNYSDGFILNCCNLSLKYFPLNVQAILLKAETLKRIYEKEKLQKEIDAKKTYLQMEQLYVKLFDLGYREMPDKMYQVWLLSVVKEKDKYSNKQVKETIQGNKN